MKWISPVAAAQQNNAVNGGLSGYVTDSTGAAVSKAQTGFAAPD